MLGPVTVLDICLAGLGVVLVQRILSSKSRGSLPPGPRKLPIVGNLFDMPSIRPWLTFAEWGRLYGDMSSAVVLGQPIIILNSLKHAIDMLDKKSSIYSDRPVLQMGGELVGWKNTLVLLPYGDRFREYRKNFHRVIGSRVSMEKYHDIEEIETHRFLKRVAAKPADLADHVRHTAGAIILRISHGYEVKEHEDPFILLADKAVNQFSMSTATGAFLVDVLPILKKMPEWLPGASFKRLAREWNACLEETVSMPYNMVKEQIAAGIAPKSFTANLLESDKTLSAEDEHIIKWSAASLYTGGADTTVSAIYSLFLAMTLFPEVQKKAQAEIDAVVGTDRLPTFHDRDSLPYVEALSKEVLRWNSVVPLAIAHVSTADDVHEGYFIPKGSLIMPNIWFMLHDPRSYPDPDSFDPSRYIATEGKPVQPDPRNICFGFGRRICPGLHLADASVFISCAMALAVFDISKVIENGVEIIPEVDPSTGTISHPKPFKCSIKPRSQKALSLIQQDV